MKKEKKPYLGLVEKRLKGVALTQPRQNRYGTPVASHLTTRR
jgi:hypothetical protein